MDKIICKPCRKSFYEDFNDLSKKIICPFCGADNITACVNISDNNSLLNFHDYIKGVEKEKDLKEPLRETFDGEELYRKKIEWVDKKRLIDRVNNRYFELVKTKNGEIIHSCDEKLSEHFGHGSAKIKYTQSFIILNYNDFLTTIELVDKLITYQLLEKIIIVDNKSTNDSYSELQKKYKNSEKIIIIQSDKNGGYSYGNNFGINFFLNNNFTSDFVVISNPDICISEENLKQLLQIAKSDKNIGALAPMMNIKNQNIYKISAWKLPGYFYDFLSSVPFFRRYAHKLVCYRKNYFDKDKVPVDVLPGSFLMMQKKILQEGIRFDDRFFLFCEERIFCEKIRKLNYKIILATKIQYDHFESVSIKKNFSKETARQTLLNDSKKKYYNFYKSKNKIRNFFLFMAIDFNFLLLKAIYRMRCSK